MQGINSSIVIYICYVIMCHVKLRIATVFFTINLINIRYSIIRNINLFWSFYEEN